MSRTIKFRAKDIETGKWVYGYYVKREEMTLAALWPTKEAHAEAKKENTKHFIFSDGFSDWNMTKPWYKTDVDPDTVCEFTGLQDKDRKDIYESDMVKVRAYYDFDFYQKNENTGTRDELIGRVYWYELGARFVIASVRSGPTAKEFDLNIDTSHELDLKVVGNIYDDPQLLGMTSEKDV